MRLDADELGCRTRALHQIDKFINAIIRDICHEENLSLPLNRILEFP